MVSTAVGARSVRWCSLGSAERANHAKKGSLCIVEETGRNAQSEILVGTEKGIKRLIRYHYEGYRQAQNTRHNHRPSRHSQQTTRRRKTRSRIEGDVKIREYQGQTLPAFTQPPPTTSTDTLTHPPDHIPQRKPPY